MKILLPQAEAGSLNLPNFMLLEKQPRNRIRLYYEISDVSIVHLADRPADRPAFRRVIPSKMFEAMSLGIPVVLGVRGQAAQIIEESGAGTTVSPDSPEELRAAVLKLKDDERARLKMGRNGQSYVRSNYDRRAIAHRYWMLLQRVAAVR